jgi:hypothetical protein
MPHINYDLDRVLIEFPGKEKSITWTVRNAVEGVQIFGGIGSGKTSGSGKFLALKYLEAGLGGLVLTAKHDEKDLWEDYCRQAGRQSDLIIVEPGGKHAFNFLEYESSSAGSKRSLTMNIVQVLKTVIRANQEKSSGRGDDRFWETALDILIGNTIDLCLQAYDKVTVRQLYEIAQSAPKKTDPTPKKADKEEVEKDKQPSEPEKPKPFKIAYDIAMRHINNQVANWKAQMTKEFKAQIKDAYHFTQLASEALPDVRTMKFVNDFFNDSYKNIADKTRSIIDFSLIGFLYNLLREPTYSLFCNLPSTFTPEDSLKGKIILINLPVKDYHKMGQDCQVMFKYIWQRAMERRRVKENGLPVFLWADESQNFLHEHDAAYQATARSSRIATVYISQNLPNYFASMGGENSSHKVKSFLGTLGTKIFHANADIETNTYASDLMGEAYQKDETLALNSTDGKVSETSTISATLKKVVRPEEFGLLKTGSAANKNVVTGYIHVQGKKFMNGFNFEKITINQ